jgi:hypothetical protein
MFVNLSSCGLTSADLQHLADWLGVAYQESRSSVRHLNLSFNRISLLDQGENFLMILLQSMSGSVDVYCNPCASSESEKVFAKWSRVELEKKNFFKLIWISATWHLNIGIVLFLGPPTVGERYWIRTRHHDYYGKRMFPRYG